MKQWACAATVLLVAATGMAAHQRHHRAQSGQAGVFDFYLFVLSWSPEFCHSNASAAECSEHKGFVVHGLWPQNDNGSYPQNCATSEPGPTHASSMADIMPAEIIEHEWRTHGTCSGLSGDAYFALVRKVYESVKIPAQLAGPKVSKTMRPGDLKRAFTAENGNLTEADLAVEARGHYLRGVEFCFSKSASPVPVACARVRDAVGGTLVVPPVR